MQLLILCNQIKWAIDEWGTGRRINIHFTSEGYQDVFEEHLHVFNEFADYCEQNGCPDLVLKLLECMHDHGRCHTMYVLHSRTWRKVDK
jgi:Domain of unknown function (DUF6532)